ncbi:hypothetical protein CLM62_12930 [Streptomyces sp. SA15]|uniref:hypothetical protein n=1 Tax=Streptomyces sp. SA15 TaxID=934019 RepID=UPI000BB07877|nr:hypothetical protein [Streptomyces sp. SA15]PAZ15695.1 hypothetical protein CLM62_12930 [Streptomyces sp. SA15]
MSTHRGTAVLLLEDGREFDVAADLTKTILNGRTIWGGTLSVPDQSKPIELMNLQQGIVRIGGAEGAFNRTDISDWLDSPAGLFRIRVEGNGDAPF